MAPFIEFCVKFKPIKPYSIHNLPASGSIVSLTDKSGRTAEYPLGSRLDIRALSTITIDLTVSNK